MGEADVVKTVAEVVGALLTTTAIVLTGRTGRLQRWGVLISLIAVVPWTVFAVVTSSWMLLIQSAVSCTACGVNLIHLGRRAADAP